MLSEQVPYYILDLLQQVPSVDVAGLGRFEAIFQPAVVDLPASKVKPPYIKPDFRDTISTENHILEAYIRYASGADLPTITSAVHDFVQRVHDRTADGQSYLIETFGTFSKNESGGLRFTPDWDAFNLSFRGLDVLDFSERPVEPSRESYSTTPFPEPGPSLEPVPEPHIEPHSEIHLPVHPIISPPNDSTARHIEESTSRLWWVILISALVLITVLCAYLAWDILSNRTKLDELKQVYPDSLVTAHLRDTSITSDTTHLQVQPIPLPEPEPEKTETPLPIPEATNKPDESYCYVVVGAFGSENNVTRMSDRLSSSGYTVQLIKGGALTKVAIRTSCIKDTLQQILNDARTTINPESWIY